MIAAAPEVIQNSAPATGALQPPVPVDSTEAVVEAVRAARAAQPAWAARSFPQRREVLLRFKDELLKAVDEVSDLLIEENGKSRFEALTTEILTVADLTKFYARKASRLLRDQRLPLHLFPHKKSLLRYSPRGVIGVISPWNFPFSIPVGDVVMSLAAGNAVVLKPSEFTPRIALLARRLFDRAGLPADLFRVVNGRGPTGASLIQAGVDMVVFTGSVPTGKKIAVACAERLIPCILELGGKDPAIVLDDADLDRAAKAVVWGAFANSGQVCASVERVYVDRKVAAAFTQRVVELAQSLKQGDPTRGMVDVGAMVTPRQLEIVKRHVDEAVAAGAKVLTGGAPLPGPGRYFQPTVLSGVTPQMAVMRDETFGPVLPIQEVSGEDEAVGLANDSRYGLTAYVFGGGARARRVADRLMAGSVLVNDVLFHHGAPETPWGGIKDSGLGRVHGLHGLQDLSLMRHLDFERIPLPKPWYYPYTDRMYGLLRKVFRWVLG
ncbi:MAG: aldehyde dehydrogenase family protein [Myxococcales bacterium]